MFNGYPILSGFVGYTAYELPVRPLRDLLVGLASKSYSVLDVAHSAHGKARYSLFPAKPHRLPRGFVQDVALLAVELCAGFGFVLEQLAMPLRSRFAAVNSTLVGCQLLVSQLLCRTEGAPANPPPLGGHDSSSLFGDYGGNVDFAQVPPK